MLKALTNCFDFVESLFPYQYTLDFLIMDPLSRSCMNALIFSEDYIQLLLKIKKNVDIILIHQSSQMDSAVFYNKFEKRICYIPFKESFSKRRMIENILRNTLKASLQVEGRLFEENVEDLFIEYKKNILQ